MSYSEFLPFTAQQEATVAPADLTILNNQLQYPAVQTATNGQFAQTIIDPMLNYQDMSGTYFQTTWAWLDSSDPLQPLPPLQQDCIAQLDSAAELFEQNTLYQPTLQNSHVTSSYQPQLYDSKANDKVDELMAMFLNFQETTNHRIRLVEEDVKAFQSRLEDETTRLCEEVNDAILRLQTWTEQVRGAVENAMRSCESH